MLEVGRAEVDAESAAAERAGGDEGGAGAGEGVEDDAARGDRWQELLENSHPEVERLGPEGLVPAPSHDSTAISRSPRFTGFRPHLTM